jgi:hypothetical protein
LGQACIRGFLQRQKYHKMGTCCFHSLLNLFVFVLCPRPIL